MPIIICESWLSLFQLSGLAEVFLQDEKRNEFFSFLVRKLADVFVGVAGYFDGFVGVGGIVGDTLFEVREIGFDFDIVVVGNKSSLHEPSFEFGSGHDGYGVGGHDPFEIAGDIVPSRARINLYRRCSAMVFLPVRQAGLPLRLVSPKS